MKTITDDIRALREKTVPHAPYIAATQGQIAASQAHTKTVRGIVAGLLFRVGHLSILEDAAYDREDSTTGNQLLQRLGESMRSARMLASTIGIRVG